MSHDRELRAILNDDLVPLAEQLDELEREPAAADGPGAGPAGPCARLVTEIDRQREDLRASFHELGAQIEVVLSRGPIDEPLLADLREQEATLAQLLATCDRIRRSGSTLTGREGSDEPGPRTRRDQNAGLLRESA